MPKYIIPSAILLVALVVCTSFAYGQDIAANTAFTGNSVNVHGYAGESAHTWLYGSEPVKRHYQPNYDTTGRANAYGKAGNCVVGGALLAAIGGTIMLVDQHNQTGSGFQLGAGCTVFGGAFVLIGGWAFLILKFIDKVIDRPRSYSLIIDKNQVGIAYKF